MAFLPQEINYVCYLPFLERCYEVLLELAKRINIELYNREDMNE